MADKDSNIIAKDYGIGIKPPAQHFHVKGHENAGWGMKARLSQILRLTGAQSCWRSITVTSWAVQLVWKDWIWSFRR